MEMQGQNVFSVEQESNASFHKLLRMTTIAILVSFIGTLVGMFVPPALFLPLVIVEFIMIFAAFFIRRKAKSIGYGFVFAFTLISGITLYPAVAYYSAGSGGFSVVNGAFLVTTAIFAGLTMYAYYSKRDFSFLGGMLTMGIIALIGFSLIGMFTGGFGGALGFGIAIFGVLIFSGYTLYDVSRYKHGVSEQEMPLAVLSLYLNFINLFLYILRLFGLSRD